MITSSAWASLSDLRQELVDDVGEIKSLEALDFASHVLWSLSGRLYGPVRVTTEAYDTRTSLAQGSRVYPIFMDGVPYNVSTCSSCSCSGCGVFHRTRLRGYPVRSIIDVWAEGKLLSRDDYVLLDNSVLGLTNVAACAAQCLVVKYAYGSGIPPGGKNAAVKLAEELLESSRGGDCSLPERVTSVSRQGMSWTLLDPQDFLESGRTGIYEIDLMLASLNPARALARPRVFSPDLPRATAYQYAAPPLSIMLEPGDQVVQKGLAARWVSNDLGMLNAVRNGQHLSTVTELGSLLSGQWHELVTHAGGVVLDVTEYEVDSLYDGMKYEVRDGSTVLMCGLVRIL